MACNLDEGYGIIPEEGQEAYCIPESQISHSKEHFNQ